MKKTLMIVAAVILSLGLTDVSAATGNQKTESTPIVQKVENGAVNAYRTTRDGTVKTAKKVGKFSEKTYDKAKKGTVKTAKKVGKFSEKTYDKAKKGTVKTAKKVGKFSEKTYDKAKNGIKNFFDKDK